MEQYSNTGRICDQIDSWKIISEQNFPSFQQPQLNPKHDYFRCLKVSIPEPFINIRWGIACSLLDCKHNWVNFTRFVVPRFVMTSRSLLNAATSCLLKFISVGRNGSLNKRLEWNVPSADMGHGECRSKYWTLAYTKIDFMETLRLSINLYSSPEKKVLAIPDMCDVC